MHILTDAGADLVAVQHKGLTIHAVPLVFTLEGRTYRSGIDIQPAEFYKLLAATRSFPSTSQPAPGDFAAAYRRLAATGDRDVLSIHISSGLSGTINAARLGAQEVPEANVTFVDTLTLSAAEGWQVEAAGRMIQAGWPLDRILPALERIKQATETFYTLETLRYLEHGGRISHIQALLGQILDLKPIIGVEKVYGRYAMHGRERSLKPGSATAGRDRGRTLRHDGTAAGPGHARPQPCRRAAAHRARHATLRCPSAARGRHRAGARRAYRARSGGHLCRAAERL